MICSKETLVNPVLGENLEDLCQFLHNLRNWNVNDLLHSPLLDSFLGNGLRHFHQLFRHFQPREHRRLCSTARCKLRSRFEVLGTSVTCSTICDT